jgi:hypothetical protein
MEDLGRVHIDDHDPSRSAGGVAAIRREEFAVG